MQLQRGRKNEKVRKRKKVECEATMIRPQKIIRGGPRDSLAVWKDIISHLLPVQKGSLEVERMDGSRPGCIQEVRTALLEGERERERESLLKNYDINASSLEINASGTSMLE